MTHALKLQGRIFCAVALMLVVAMTGRYRSDPAHGLLVVGVLILLLGVPHGALDVMVARRLFGALSLRLWLGFLLAYVGLAALVVVVWFLAPTLFLCAFLFVSALHFGGDMAMGGSRLARILYGGAVIVLPALQHEDQLQYLLGVVAGPASAAFIVPVLSLFATPWLCATAVACALVAKRTPAAVLEWAALVAVVVAAPPLMAFTVYFCAMHSPRHILKTFGSLRGIEVRNALKMALWPTAIVLGAAVLTLTLASAIAFETRLMQFIFVGLAALTLPHMVLLEGARHPRLSLKKGLDSP
jgi:Brp/Blh family beta-carotene 15,15'-monooxygenase